MYLIVIKAGEEFGGGGAVAGGWWLVLLAGGCRAAIQWASSRRTNSSLDPAACRKGGALRFPRKTLSGKSIRIRRDIGPGRGSSSYNDG